MLLYTNDELRTMNSINNNNNNNNNNNEAVYGNEIKRRRINRVGDHLKVWEVCNMEYISHEEKEEEMKLAQEPVYQVQEPVYQVPPPVQLIGRSVVVETTNQRIYRGTIQGLFELNGERAIHIQTDDGQNLIYTTSQLCAACVLYNAEEEEVLSPIPRRHEDEDDVVRIDDEDDEEIRELTQRMEVVQINSDSDNDNDNDNDNDSDVESDASTQIIQDDEPDENERIDDEPFRYHHHAPAEEEEPNCCAICLDVTDPARNFVSLNCGHQFHFACVMGNMANGGYNRNQCPMCRDRVIHMDDDVQNLDAVHEELNLMRQHREDLTAEYLRVMSMQLQINLRYHADREARNALERRAYICGLNERIAAIVTNASNNDLRQDGPAMHTERQIRDLCMSFGMMAYDAQYDQPNPEDQYQYPEDQYQDADEDRMD